MKTFLLFAVGCLCLAVTQAQPDRWQQRVKYKMDIDMDVTTNRFTGKQQLEYTNNSPDTLYKVFYHLYFNAFQPNSSMDVRSRELGKNVVNGRADWDGRVRDRILNLKPDEIGYQKILSLKMNGVAQEYKVQETILEVKLKRPILPKSKVVFDMNFEAQVPVQIRRSGRDNPITGVRYSMSQWYPKMCEYDYEGWHPTPYIAREFYGVWGDYEVKIKIDKNYIIGGTGYLQNANQIGYGYETPGMKVVRPAGDKLTWIFTAPNVHDFVWAADPEFKHIVKKAADGVTINVLYKATPTQHSFNVMSPQNKAAYNNDFKVYAANWDKEWERIGDAAVTVLPFIEKNFGDYAYKQYSFIHGGDGGMEYPMATLIVSPSLGTAIHEWMHSWYQMMLATNESMYAWMDEGFTSYAETLVGNYYEAVSSGKAEKSSSGTGPRKAGEDLGEGNVHKDAYNSYFALVRSGKEEPLTTHADHFEHNFAYSVAAYSKGEVFVEQLGYIVGAQVRDKILLDYYKQWRFKHPNVNDFMRVAEKASGIQLDWYREYWVNTTKTIDYGIDSLWQDGNKTNIRLKRTGKMPMPVDVEITYKDGSKEIHYVPLNLMYGAKPSESSTPVKLYDAWKWTHPTYVIQSDKKITDIKSVIIDVTERMADVNRNDNVLRLNF